MLLCCVADDNDDVVCCCCVVLLVVMLLCGVAAADVALLRLLNPKIEYTPPKMRKLKAVYQDAHCKTGGLTMSQIEECVAWVNEEPLRTVCFLDRLLEIDDRVLDGLTLIPALTLKGALVIVFSGNDSDEDQRLYLSTGVH